MPQEKTAAAESAKLLDVKAVATICDCSPRHVYRLADSGKMPSPIKLGALVRWSADSIHAWIEQGCPTVRNMSKGVRHA